MRTRATNDAADQVASHSSNLSAEFAWQGLRACRWVGAYFTGAIMPGRSTVDFSQLRSSSKSPMGVGAIVAGWKANGEVHDCSLGVETHELGFAGLSLGVTWLSLRWIKGPRKPLVVSRYVLATLFLDHLVIMHAINLFQASHCRST